MASELSQRQALMALGAISGLGPITTQRLLAHFRGDAPACLRASALQLAQVKGLNRKVQQALLAWEAAIDLHQVEQRMQKSQTRFVISQDAAYPECLKSIHNPPLGLYWQGTSLLPAQSIAIVGTRRPTLYGLRMAKLFASELAQAGFCIVSGLARGIDTAAHQGALAAGGKTVAVCGCGLDHIYPPENFELLQAIVSQGAAISEFPFGRRADRQTFPMRNRIVAGMSQALIVIESDASGGSLISARFAGEQGRALMAVPGRIDQASSAGCHQLIRDGATLVASVEDVLEELKFHLPPSLQLDFTPDLLASNTPTEASALSASEEAVMRVFRGGERFNLDAIGELCDLTAQATATTVLQLELKRLLQKQRDGLYEAL